MRPGWIALPGLRPSPLGSAIALLGGRVLRQSELCSERQIALLGGQSENRTEQSESPLRASLNGFALLSGVERFVGMVCYVGLVCGTVQRTAPQSAPLS